MNNICIEMRDLNIIKKINTNNNNYSKNNLKKKKISVGCPYTGFVNNHKKKNISYINSIYIDKCI